MQVLKLKELIKWIKVVLCNYIIVECIHNYMLQVDKVYQNNNNNNNKQYRNNIQINNYLIQIQIK